MSSLKLCQLVTYMYYQEDEEEGDALIVSENFSGLLMLDMWINFFDCFDFVLIFVD